MKLEIDPALLLRRDRMGPGFCETTEFYYPGFPPAMYLRFDTRALNCLRLEISYDEFVMEKIHERLQRWFDKQSGHGKLSILTEIEEAKASGYVAPVCSEECLRDDG